MKTKTKVSITLAPDVVLQVDRAAKLAGQSRSELIEVWLQKQAEADYDERVRADTIRYYESLTPEDRAEDEAMARASSKAARRLRIDG
jgi:metal-responsive CopG/Arc/MetJ family transcriptional regulator